jgi:hypothetical protein
VERPERERKPTPYIGVVSVPAPPPLSAQLGLEEGFGLVVDSVLPDSPAQAAGIQRWDLLKLLNDQQLVSPDQLGRLVNRLGKGADATLTIIRKGQEQKVTIKVGEKLLPARSDQDGMRFPGFGGSGGFDRPMDSEQLEQIRRRVQETSGREGGDAMRDMQERMQGMQEKMRAYQEAMRRYQELLREWQKNPSGELPQMPQFPELPGRPRGDEGRGRPPQFGVRPADLLREMRPGERPQMQSEWSEGSSRWDATRARVTMRDSDGELEVTVKDGKRVLTIKNPQGEIVFNGPIDSPEEREAIPQKYRDKLANLAPPRPPAGNEPPRPRTLNQLRPPIDREPNVQ